jgi:succinate dehydrogenase / fumarate reductase, cytochrome b subunit
VESNSSASVASDDNSSFLAKHEFLLRRLHSLTGLIPVGAYMVVHLLTNASVLESAAKFQLNVYMIHSLGKILPIVEWGFIFIPILFHAIFGMVIIMGGLPNTRAYPYEANLRYTLQRATGMIAFLFIVWHVFHLHGWIHASWWIDGVAKPLHGAQFRPYNATSSAGLALQSGVVMLMYTIGVLSCVFHLANGLWTMGITWGVWISPRAQKQALRVCGAFGVLLAVVGMSALYGMWSNGRGEALQEARSAEDKIYDAKMSLGEIEPTPEKRAEPLAEGETATAAVSEKEEGPKTAPGQEQPKADEATSPAAEDIDAGAE